MGANNQFWLLDKSGLITKARKDLDPAATPFARGFGLGEIEGLGEGASLLEVVGNKGRHVKCGNLYIINNQPGREAKMTISRMLVLLIICLSFCGAFGEDGHMKYKDPKAPLLVRVDDLLRRMTLAEKIGQMLQSERAVATPEIVKDNFIGSLLSGGGSVPAPRASPETWIDMVNNFHKGALSTQLGIPMIYGIDAVHGHNNIYKATIFPHNVGLGATRDPELAKRIGTATALEVRATGIPYVFAPCVAICKDPRWGRCYESYSEDPKVVQSMTEIISGLQGEVPEKKATKKEERKQQNLQQGNRIGSRALPRSRTKHPQRPEKQRTTPIEGSAGHHQAQKHSAQPAHRKTQRDTALNCT